MNRSVFVSQQQSTNDGSRDTLFVRWYPQLLLCLWVLVPEIRRLIDWQHGFNSLSIINVIPTLALAPLLVSTLRGDWKEVSYAFKVTAALWLAAFFYSLLVGYLASRLFGAVYEFVQFTFPLLAGIWLAMMKADLAKRTLERFVTAALWLSIVVSVYGIYQYISPPPWDVYWMVNSGLNSIGNPAPFEVRVFSCLNSPLTCADFLTLTIIVALYRFKATTVWLVVPLVLSIAALGLTLVRTAWLEVMVGVVVFLCLSPRRRMVAGTATFALVLVLLVVANLQFLTGNPQVAIAIQDRIDTFTNLQDDGSADSRQHGSANTLHQSLEEPLGQGLGFAAGAKLSGSSTAMAAATTGADNGYLERFLEMGVFGFLLYLASVGSAIIGVFLGWRRAFAAHDKDSAVFFAMIIAIEAALIGADLSADHHVGLMAVFYWFVAGFGSSLLRLNVQRAGIGGQRSMRPVLVSRKENYE